MPSARTPVQDALVPALASLAFSASSKTDCTMTLLTAPYKHPRDQLGRLAQ